MIPREASEGGRTTVAAFVAYTRRGAVFARSPEWGALRLPLVRPTDFCAPDRVVAAVASATSGRPVRPDVPDGDPEVQDSGARTRRFTTTTSWAIFRSRYRRFRPGSESPAHPHRR